MIRYIDHEIHGEDWRKINRNELDATRKKQLVKWLAIHKAKTTCDCCHHRIVEYCRPCKVAMKKFNEEKKKSKKNKKLRKYL